MQLDPSFCRMQGICPSYFAVSIDTRTLQPGDCFFALAGNTVDGHMFIREAVAKGASGIVVMNTKKQCLPPIIPEHIFVASVDDTVQFLCALAKAWRSQFSYPVIAVTGSVGKTSTKERIVQVLTEAGKTCLSSVANQNTLLSLAIALLRMRHTHDVAIFEVGISGCGQMAVRADMIRPTIAIVTTIGHSHLEGIGTLDDVAREKSALFSYLTPTQVGIINGDQPYLLGKMYHHKIITCGVSETNAVRVKLAASDSNQQQCYEITFDHKYRCSFPAPTVMHEGIMRSMVYAAAVAHVLGVPVTDIAHALQKPLIVPQRFQIIPLKQGRGIVIDDCYNASPESMKAALVSFAQLPVVGARVLVLGDMLELGPDSDQLHCALVDSFPHLSPQDAVILVGEKMAQLKERIPNAIPCYPVVDWQAALPIIEQTVRKLHDGAILVKASHGMQLSHVVHNLIEME